MESSLVRRKRQTEIKRGRESEKRINFAAKELHISEECFTGHLAETEIGVLYVCVKRLDGMPPMSIGRQSEKKKLHFTTDKLQVNGIFQLAIYVCYSNSTATSHRPFRFFFHQISVRGNCMLCTSTRVQYGTVALNYRELIAWYFPRNAQAIIIIIILIGWRRWRRHQWRRRRRFKQLVDRVRFDECTQSKNLVLRM